MRVRYEWTVRSLPGCQHREWARLGPPQRQEEVRNTSPHRLRLYQSGVHGLLRCTPALPGMCSSGTLRHVPLLRTLSATASQF